MRSELWSRKYDSFHLKCLPVFITLIKLCPYFIKLGTKIFINFRLNISTIPGEQKPNLCLFEWTHCINQMFLKFIFINSFPPTFKLDFSLRDDATANSKLDQNTAFGTAGQKVINIYPTIDYVVNSRIRATLFFQQTRTIPKIATTAPITNTRAGLQLTISLAQ